MDAKTTAAMGVGALLLGLAAVADCSAAPVDALDFASKPSGEDFARFFPPHALNLQLGGAAAIHCRIAATGELEKCVVLAEAPAEERFGEAALKIATKWRLTDKSARLHLGEAFVTTIRFNINNGGSPALSFMPGTPGSLVTFVHGKGAAHGQEFDCPSPADPARLCRAHVIAWAASPKLDDVLDVLAKADIATGKTLVECKPTAGGVLADCRVTGDFTPKAQAAALAYAKTLSAPSRAQDHTPVSSGHVLFVLDWAEIAALREKIAPADY